MNILKPINFISVEGFWEKSVHEARMKEAAEKLHADSTAFAIATATHAPHPSISFTKMPLGKYTSKILVEKYDIHPMRILPAYLFDQKTTYTIIDAYSNAMMIGWVCCGLSTTNSHNMIDAYLTPVTEGFQVQAERILALNTRSLKALNQLSLKTKINAPDNLMSFEELEQIDIEEANKLLKIKEPGGVIDSGKWPGNSGIIRSFDNIEAMRIEIEKMFKLIFGINIENKFLFGLSDLERLILTLILNIKANTDVFQNKDIKDVCEFIRNFFSPEITVKDIENTINLFNNKGLI